MASYKLLIIFIFISSVFTLDTFEGFRDKIFFGGFRTRLEQIKKDSHFIAAIPAQYYKQKINHLDTKDTRTFNQKYYVNDAIWDKNAGPVFLMLGGEAPESSYFVEAGEMFDLGKVHKALLVTIEHRYYGVSQPFDIWNTTNLYYLTSQQALADFAEIQQYLTQTIVKNPNTKWFVFGGSYPGCLSAWYRLKYPNLVVGSVAASPPVEAKEPHTGIDDYEIKAIEKYDPACVNVIHSTIVEIDQRLSSKETAQKLLDLFGCSEVKEIGDFGWAIYFEVMENSFELCDALKKSKDKVATYAKEFARMIELQGLTCKQMNLQYLFGIGSGTSEKANPGVLGGRPWIYQSCNEFGYWHVPATKNYLKTTFTDVAYHRRKCAEIYGIPLQPNIDQTNKYYGGWNISTSNTIFWNGQADHWSELSVLNSLSDTVVATYCPGGTHCENLLPASPGDSSDLKKSREFVAQYVAKFLGS